MQKHSFFTRQRPFLTKLLFFQTIESAKRTLPPGVVQENLHFCMRYFSKMKNKTAEKIARQCFSVKSKVTCKNLTHLEARKKMA